MILWRIQTVKVEEQRSCRLRWRRWVEMQIWFLLHILGTLVRKPVVEGEQATMVTFDADKDEDGFAAGVRSLNRMNEMIKLQSQLTLTGTEPLTADEICDKVLRKSPGYYRGLGHGLTPASSSLASIHTQCNSQVLEEENRANNATRHANELDVCVSTQQKELHTTKHDLHLTQQELRNTKK
ncbi:hypothetical protein F0562_019415 [Nyssa sinensis]|uniref:Uncharacterized protein n=1 Tax=Nyssa sinensis TaxID=561372 RepID=A0A5J4ZEQ7_9ASTE|nr:hypothetical protein F0562_019415 [Nyssa sinensis]